MQLKYLSNKFNNKFMINYVQYKILINILLEFKVYKMLFLKLTK